MVTVFTMSLADHVNLKIEIENKLPLRVDWKAVLQQARDLHALRTGDTQQLYGPSTTALFEVLVMHVNDALEGLKFEIAALKSAQEVDTKRKLGIIEQEMQKSIFDTLSSDEKILTYEESCRQPAPAMFTKAIEEAAKKLGWEKITVAGVNTDSGTVAYQCQNQACPRAVVHRHERPTCYTCGERMLPT